jgi:hypothetical protein
MPRGLTIACRHAIMMLNRRVIPSLPIQPEGPHANSGIGFECADSPFSERIESIRLDHPWRTTLRQANEGRIEMGSVQYL